MRLERDFNVRTTTAADTDAEEEKKSPRDEIDVLVGRLPDEPLVSSPIPASTFELPFHNVSSVKYELFPSFDKF